MFSKHNKRLPVYLFVYCCLRGASHCILFTVHVYLFVYRHGSLERRNVSRCPLARLWRAQNHYISGVEGVLIAYLVLDTTQRAL